MYDILFWIILVFIWCPIYSKYFLGLHKPAIFNTALIISIILFIGMLFLFKETLSFVQKASVLLMMSPVIFIGLFKLVNYVSLQINKREIKNINRFLLKDGESYTALDVICFLILLFIPFAIPMAIREIYYPK